MSLPIFFPNRHGTLIIQLQNYILKIIGWQKLVLIYGLQSSRMKSIPMMRTGFGKSVKMWFCPTRGIPASAISLFPTTQRLRCRWTPVSANIPMEVRANRAASFPIGFTCSRMVFQERGAMGIATLFRLSLLILRQNSCTIVKCIIFPII